MSPPCSVEGCPHAARGRGLCPKHYQAERRKAAGKTPREDLGPSPRRREFLVPEDLDTQILKVVPEKDVGAFLRRAARTQLLLERGAGGPVKLG